MIPEELKYTSEHEWARIEGDTATIGITDHAQNELGDITFVEVPEVDGTLKQNEVFGTIESVKAASDLYAPLSGTITEVNPDLESSPEVINESPYEKGWILKIKISDKGEEDSLLSAADYKAVVEAESE
jgi:glycine cleavage system H protein